MPAEKKLFLVCRKSGKIVGFNRRGWLFRLLLPLMGVLALVWWLVRVIPKPSRADYPCQRVGLPIALQGIAMTIGLFALPVSFRKFRKFLDEHRYEAAAVCLVLCLGCSLLVRAICEYTAHAEDTGTFAPAEGPNQPMGTGRGIFPGRVAWAYDLSACKWDGLTGYWFDKTNNDQTRITAMMNKTICSVAGQPTIELAWDALFRFKNAGAPYLKGEKIVVKLNLNNGGNYDNQIDASPQSVYALLEGLVNHFGVDQSDIVLCDPARENQCSVVRDYCVGEFPKVNYDTHLGGFVPNAFSYSAPGPAENSLSKALVDAKYLITLAILKRHCTPAATYHDPTDHTDYGNASVSMIFKSTWGLIGPGRGNQHQYLHDWACPLNSYDLLVDMMGNKNVDGKTVLNLVDGLYSGDRWSSGPHRWKLAPFNGHWPSSIFASQDPVALESVGLDFLRSEMPLIKNADHHLHEAALANDPPSGTVYKPDGVRLQSLGVHEHWNNAADKKYSRNLGTGKGIELVTIQADAGYADSVGGLPAWVDRPAHPGIKTGEPQFQLGER
jgi:hypothetical protein